MKSLPFNVDLVVAAIEAVEVLVFSPLFVPKRQKAQLWTLINIYIILNTWIFYTNAIDHSSVIIIEYGWGITMEICHISTLTLCTILLLQQQ